MCDYLELCAKNGIVFNPKKFVFCADTVEFAGFEIGPASVKPGAKMLETIREFPEPRTLSHIRGWFGLINQVAPILHMQASHGTISGTPKAAREGNQDILGQ